MPARKRPTPAQLQRQVDNWNAKHPVGTVVSFENSSATAKHTVAPRLVTHGCSAGTPQQSSWTARAVLSIWNTAKLLRDKASLLRIHRVRNGMQDANSAHAEHLASNHPLEDVLRREEMVTAVELGAG